MKLKDIRRTATFAWDPSSASEPLIVTGAVAGALDESFSNDSQLEIWAPKLYEAQSGADGQGFTLGGQGSSPKGSVTVASRFNRLAWSQPEASPSGRGIIAAGLETGEVCLYDPVKILAKEEALIYKNDKHTGSVRGLHWNPIKKNLLLSGGVNAELYIHDVNNLGSPIPPGPVSTKLNEITSLAWNPSVSSVFAASSSSGFTSIWDLRHSKEIAALQYGGGAAKGDFASGGAGTQIGKRRGMSDLCWHPEQATRLVTASEDDESPIVMMWDLRNTRAPERILSGHTKGVLSVSWCKQDADLLASCGKDNRTLLWNPQSGEVVGELAHTSDWSFETAWCPSNPNLLAVASFDGHIGINSLQSTGDQEPEDDKLAADATADDIFANLGTSSTSNDKANAKSLTQAPKWMLRPCSATWGYGGLLATVSNLSSASGKHQSGVVHLRTVVTEESILERAKALDEISGDKEKLAQFSNSKSENPSWKALQSLFQANSRDELVSLLGFSKEEVARQVDELVKSLVPTIVEEGPEGKGTKGDVTPKTEDRDPMTEGEKTPEANKASTNALFVGDDRPVTPADVGGDTDFFSSMATGSLRNPQLDSVIPHLNPAADSSVAATVGSGPSSVRSESMKDNVFRIYPTGESDTDRLITQALVLGDFSSAVNLCLASERYADALLLAVRGGPELLQSTQKAYFNRRTMAHPFLRVFQSIVTEDLADIVQNADLAEWKVVFVVLCTYAKEADFANLADQLGRRLQFKWQLLSGSDSPEAKSEAKIAREDATLCYLAARNLEHVVGIWINEMQEEEAATDAPRYSAHANALQSFVEKVSAFQSATGYVDKDLTATVPAGEAGARSYALTGLYDRFYEYADLLATQGLVDVAVKYVRMTPKGYSGTDGYQLDKARSRVFAAAGIPEGAVASTVTAFGSQPSNVGASTSTHKPSASISRYPATAGYSSSPYAQTSPYSAVPAAPFSQPASNPYGAPAPARGPSPAATTGPYAPPPTSGPYAPPTSASQPAGPYGPATTSAPSNPYAPAPGAGGPSQYSSQQSAYGANTFQPASTYGSNGYGEPQSQGYGTYGGSSYGAPPAPSLGPPPRGEVKDHIVPASQRRDMPGWNDAPSLASGKRSGGGTPKPVPITSPFPMSEQAQSPSAFPPPPHTTSTPPPPRGGPPGVLPPPPKGGPRPPSAAKVTSPQQPSYGQLPPQQQTYGAPPSQFGQAPQSPPQQHVPQYAPPPKAGPPPPRSGPRAGPPPPGVVAGPPPRALSPLGPGSRAAQQSLSGSLSPPPVAGPPPSGARTAGPPPPGRAGPRPPSHSPTPPSPAPRKPTHAPGDRTHMNDNARRVYEALSNEFARVRQVNPNAQGTVRKVIEDTERRLNILYDDLNNDNIPANSVDRLGQITQAIESRDASTAMHMHTDLLTSATTDVAHWAPGIKQLIRLGLTNG